MVKELTVGTGFNAEIVSSGSFNNIIAPEQGFIGETNSASFNMDVGWLFSIYAEGVAPVIISVSPSVDTLTIESTVTFIAIVEDLRSGLSFCNAKIYKNNLLVSDVNVIPSHGHFGECRTTLDLVEGDLGRVDWTATDNAGNTSVVTSSADFIKGNSGSPIIIGAGTGGEGDECFSSLQCLNTFYCFAGHCFYETVFILRDLNDLVVTPPAIDLEKSSTNTSAGSEFSLRVDVENIGNRIIPLTVFFDCKANFLCAKSWCSIRDLDSFDLMPRQKKNVFFDCVVPSTVSVGTIYENNLLFRTPSFAEKIVPIRIPIKRPDGTFEVKPDVPAPFEGIGSLSMISAEGVISITAEIFDYGVICFGGLKNSCLLRFGFLELFGTTINYLSLSTLLLFLLLLVNIYFYAKEKELNLWALAPFLVLLGVKLLLWLL